MNLLTLRYVCHLLPLCAFVLDIFILMMAFFLQVAAGTLDASAKIYAVRVDAVHADVYRVLGGLGKESQGPEQAEAQEAGMFSLFYVIRNVLHSNTLMGQWLLLLLILY